MSAALIDSRYRPARCCFHGRHDLAGRDAGRTHPTPETLKRPEQAQQTRSSAGWGTSTFASIRQRRKVAGDPARPTHPKNQTTLDCHLFATESKDKARMTTGGKTDA